MFYDPETLDDVEDELDPCGQPYEILSEKIEAIKADLDKALAALSDLEKGNTTRPDWRTPVQDAFAALDEFLSKYL